MLANTNMNSIPNEQTLANLLCGLEQEDYQAAISYIGYLAAMRKKKKAAESLQILSDIQGMFNDDKGWSSEQNMIADMAQFRRERMGL